MDPARAPTTINALPEEILLRVMSHLTSRQAVQTCVLSQHWHHLWRSVPCINVSIQEFESKGDFERFKASMEELQGEDEDDEPMNISMEEFEGEDEDQDDYEPMNVSVEDFEDEDEDDDDDDFKPVNMPIEEIQHQYDIEREVVFKRFVNRLLMLRNPVGLEEFRLRYSFSTGNNADSQDANDWISYASQYNARAIQVVNRYDPLELAPTSFSSNCLNSLHIASAVLVPGFFDQLQTGCPTLEYLFLHDCSVLDLQISSSTLKVLILSSEVKLSYDPDDQASISAPRLISLSMDCGLSGARLPILNNMPSLKTASISLSGDIKACDADGIRQFLGGLSDTTTLDFCYWDRKLTMEKHFRWCPTFSKLINLTLDCSCVGEDLYALIVFLQNSPNLKRLTLILRQSAESAIAGELEDRSFTCEQLQIVEIIDWRRSEMLPRVRDGNGSAPHRGVPSHPHPHLTIGESFFPSPSPSGLGRGSGPH